MVVIVNKTIFVLSARSTGCLQAFLNGPEAVIPGNDLLAWWKRAVGGSVLLWRTMGNMKVFWFLGSKIQIIKQSSSSNSLANYQT